MLRAVENAQPEVLGTNQNRAYDVTNPITVSILFV